MNLLDMTRDCIIFQRAVFCGVVIGESGQSGVVAVFDGGNPSGIEREASGSVNVSGESLSTGQVIVTGGDISISFYK